MSKTAKERLAKNEKYLELYLAQRKKESSK